MPFQTRKTITHPIPSLRFGMNNQQSPDEISDFEMADCENFAIEDDTVTMAPGYSLWDTDPVTHVGPYWGGIAFVKSDGTLVTIRQRQGTLEYSEDGEDVWTECTLPTSGSPATTIVLTQVQCTFTILNNIVLWSNGTDSVMSSTDGITWVLRTGLPKSRVVFNNGYNRVLFIDQPANPYRFDWSDLNDPLTIGASAFQLVDPNSHGPLKGAALTPEGSLLLFKEGGLYSVSQFVDDGIVDINFIGSILFTCHQTIQTTEYSVIWFGFGDVWEYLGNSIRKISGRISPAGRNDVLRSDLFCSAYYNGKYRLSIPDADVSLTYNAQEYVFHLRQPREDPIQPYVVTRNKRYIGCYFIETFMFDYGLDSTLYIGDSRSTESIFAWVNDYKITTDPNFSVDQGLGGETQTAFFESKYFTDDIPFYTKRFRKLFTNLKVTQDLTLKFGYRFVPYGEYTETSVTFQAQELNWEYDDGTEGVFAEGYGFALESLGNAFIDIENSENPRGLQFKVTFTSLEDVKIYSFAYEALIKSNKLR